MSVSLSLSVSVSFSFSVSVSPVVWGEQATMEKTTQRFQEITTTLADLDAGGLNVQTVNDLLTMYVGAASQHVLRRYHLLVPSHAS